MGVSNDQSYEEFIIQDRWRRIANRPALMILIVKLTLLIIYTIYAGIFSSFLLFTSLLILPIIPAVLFENKWEKEILSNPTSTISLYGVIQNHRLVFLLSGYVISFLIIPVGFFLRIILKRGEISGNDFDFFSLNPPHSQANIVALILVVIITAYAGILTTASFYRVRAEEHETGRRYNFITSPSQIVTLISYSYIGIYFGIILLWVGMDLNRDNEFTINQANDGTNYYNALPLDVITFWSITPIFVMISVFFVTIAIVSEFIPQVINTSVYSPPTFDQLKKWSFPYSGIIIVILFFGYFGMGYNSSTGFQVFIHYIFVFGTPILIYFLTKDYPMSGKACNNCNMLLVDGTCYACQEKAKLGMQFNMKLIGKIKHPTCPACGNIWEEISRKCTNCQFTIILSCEKCSQTLNPLWHACNLCGEPRRTIPEVALESPGSPGYARSQAFLLVLASILLPALILQVTIIIGTLNQVNNRLADANELNNLYDDYARAAFLLLTIISILSLILISFNDRKRPMMLVANKIAIVPGTILILTSMTLFVYYTLLNLIVLDFTGLIIRFLMFLFALFFLLYTIFGYYQSLLQFRPVIAFDPSLEIERGDIAY